ncbi:acetyl-CoA synthetase-like protein [Myriangium duriaei CBS 260.36]|uniref:Acetyl-CoA synthetase-like protein n=1 Tax=Myriangium duriaei CBS 260.36 TaxID=1168546 RepID=A0A9P4IZT5_9PEZI|nr:acetyl-CoA synthetase-like protein [Myriangium duriaei CBS 260.36]
MEQAGTKLLITDNQLLALSQVAADLLPNVKVWVPESDLNLFTSIPEYHSFSLTSQVASSTTPAFLNRTSGSTGGKLKTVITTHAHFIATLEATLHTIPSNTDPDTDVWLSTLSLGFFINAKLSLALNIVLGIPVVLTSRPFSPSDMGLIPRHGITFLFLPPPVAAAIAGAPFDPTIDVSSVKWLLSAGASMHAGISAAVSQRLNGVHLDLEWGTTETLLLALQRTGHASPEGSSGSLVHGVEARVVDTATGKDLGAGQAGEIYVRHTACRYGGYKDDADATVAAFDAEGWFHSGDFGYLDEECNVFITDRMKELIRVGDGYGVHVSATELETVLFAHEAVARVVVVGVPDRKVGTDRPTAFVVLADEWRGWQVEAPEELERWAGERLTGLKALSGGVLVLSEFPTTGFKINRRALRALADVKRSGLGLEGASAIRGTQLGKDHTMVRTAMMSLPHAASIAV